MSEWFYVSYALMWVLIVVLFVLVLAAARQIGLIHRRIAPGYGARMGAPGPRIGEIAPPLGERDLEGNAVTLGHLDGKRTLLVFISPGCVACDEVAPALRSIARAERRSTKTIIVMSGSKKRAHDYVARHDLGGVTAVASERVAELYDVQASPFGLMIDEKGRVLTKGVVNGFEHLESLVNAHELQIDSIESFVERVEEMEEQTTQGADA